MADGGSFSPALSPSLCRDPQEEVGPLEHPSCPVLEVLQSGQGPGRGVLAWRNPHRPPSPHAPISSLDSTNSSENMYTIMNPIGPGAGRANVSRGYRVGAAEGGGPAGDGVARVPRCPPRPQFPLGPGPEGPMAAMSAMEPHHVNGSLGEWASADTRPPMPQHRYLTGLLRPLVVGPARLPGFSGGVPGGAAIGGRGGGSNN